MSARVAASYRYETSCIQARGEDIHALQAAAVEVSLRTIRRRCVGFAQWCKDMKYGRDFPISRDWHVGYFRSMYRGRRCYYIEHSRIEYVWVEELA